MRVEIEIDLGEGRIEGWGGWVFEEGRGKRGGKAFLLGFLCKELVLGG